MTELPSLTGHLSVSLALTRIQEISELEVVPDVVKVFIVGFIIDLMLKSGSIMKAPHVLFDPTMWRTFSLDAFVNAPKTSSEDAMPEAEMGVRRDMVSVARMFWQGQEIERDNSGQVQSTVSKTGQLV